MARELYQNPGQAIDRSKYWFLGGAFVSGVAELAANHLVTGDSSAERLGRSVLRALSVGGIASMVFSTANYNYAVGQINTEQQAQRRPSESSDIAIGLRAVTRGDGSV